MTQPRLGTLRDSPAAVIAQLLIDLSLASDPGLSSSSLSWKVSADSELDTPDDTIEVHNTQSDQFGRFQISGQMSEFYGIQLKLRAADPQDAWEKVNEVVNALDQDVRQTSVVVTHADASTSTYFIGALNRKSGPLYLGREGGSTKRSIYTVNWTVDITQTA